MTKMKKKIYSLLLGVLALFTLMLGLAFSMPTKKASAETIMSTSNWSLAHEGDNMFRVQNGTMYWTTGEGTNVTHANVLDYAEINGKTLSAINAEKPGAITVTLQAPGGSIGSFFRVNINTEIAGFTTHDVGTFVVRAGWSHTDSSGTYKIDSDLYFARKQNQRSQSDLWRYIPLDKVVDISDNISILSQGSLHANSETILVKTGLNIWAGDPATPNEGGGAFLNTIYVNGTSIKDWNKKAEAMLANGEISDLSFGCPQGNIASGAPYAPIMTINSNAGGDLGSIFQTWVPTGYINGVSSFKVGKGYANLQGDTLYYVSKDVEYVKSGSSFVKVASSVDISDDFYIAAIQNPGDGTTLYYLSTGTEYWTKSYGKDSIAINENEWKKQADPYQGGAVQMSYLEFNGTPIYDINAKDNGAYGATQGNIASGGRYAPILAFLSKEVGNSIKLQIPNQYPSGSGTAADNHKTLAIKKGFYVLDTATNIKYEVTRDIQWKNNGSNWVEVYEETPTSISAVEDADGFLILKLSESDYTFAPSTWWGPNGADAKEVLNAMKAINFHVYGADGNEIKLGGDAIINIWSRTGTLSFYLNGYSSNNMPTKVTFKQGCQLPSYAQVVVGEKSCYVLTEDVTFVKDENGAWVKEEGVKTYSVTFQVGGSVYHKVEGLEEGAVVSAPEAPTKAPEGGYAYTFTRWELNGAEFDFNTPITGNLTLNAVFEKKFQAGEYDTSVTKVYFASDNQNNWMIFHLSDKDYPDSGTMANIGTSEEQIAALNLYDKIIVDGYTLRSRIAKDGKPPVESAKINIWTHPALGVRVVGAAGALNGAQRVTIRAGAQFPSYAYITEGTAAYFVTTEEITFVNRGYANGQWYQEYKVTFMADGEVVGTSTYVPDEDETPSIPAVPEKEGYTGKWEAFTAGSSANIVVNAVYTKKATVLGTTGIQELRRIDNNSNVLVILPTVNDYPENKEGNWNLGLDVSHLEKFNLLDYITINGKTLRQLKVTEMALNKWTRPGLGLTTSLSDSMTIVFKKGCEIPSYAFWQNPNGEASCYVVNGDYTCVYNAGGENAFTISGDNLDLAPSFTVDEKDKYILSDLYTPGSTKSYVFEDGIEIWDNIVHDEPDYRYGYVNPNGFQLTFDFMFTGATYYETFNINLGTEGYNGNKYHFGWRFYLLRGSDEAVTPNICTEYFANTSIHKGNIPGSANKAFGNMPFVQGQVYRITIAYKLVDAATGTVQVYTAVNNFTREDTYVLGGDFVNFAAYANSLTMNSLSNGVVTVSDPGKDMTNATPNRITLKNDGETVATVPAASYVLPALNPSDYNKGGYVFVGWTDNTNLYPAGYEVEIGNSDKTFYAVWYNFNMRDGASVRKTESSGLRFLVNADKSELDARSFYTEIGTIIAPTSYLSNRELTHKLGAGFYLEIPTTQWQDEDANSWYSAVMLNISPDQYARSFSARGYLKVEYTTGVGYVYTEYNAAEHARSVYQVANAAFAAEGLSGNAIVEEYVNSVADITIGEGFATKKNENANGNYGITVSLNDNTLTITLDKKVKAAIINGERVTMGYDTKIVIGSEIYTLNSYDMSASGTIFEFTLNGNNQAVTEKYYRSIFESYANSDAYTNEHKAYVDTLVASGFAALNASNFAEAKNVVAMLADVKTAAQLAANNTSKTTLSAPVVSKGEGYTVTWNAVADADYYTIHDNNDYRAYTVVMAGEKLSYKAEVVGNHNVYVKAHSYSQGLNSSTASNTVATPEVKPVFSYKAMQDGLYKFDSSQMKTMGISTTGCYYDSSDKKYFVYYNKDTGWSPYPIQATDWSSPEEFPAHAQRLKDMGNNIILINHDTPAMFGEGEVWEASRLKYVMDTAWSKGMKVIVCDQVLYKLSMSDNSKDSEGNKNGATSKAQVTEAIEANKGFAHYVTHPAFYGISLDDEPYAKYMSAMSYTISAIDDACEALGVEDPFYLACLFQAEGGKWQNMLDGELYYGDEDDLEAYWNKWLAIDGVDSRYLYVDIYTQHAMDQPTNRYNKSFNVVYSDDYLGGKYKFHQAITAHTQDDGVLLEQDMYMSLLYAAAHNVAGYSWFCYFPISGETSGSLAGFDGNGYGNGMGNKASGCYYNAAQRAAAQYELIQGWLDGYEWKTRSHSDSKNLLTTTLSNGTKTATMYVNADVDKMSGSVTVTTSGSVCYLVGYGVGTAETPYYKVVSGSIPLAPGQAVLCLQ